MTQKQSTFDLVLDYAILSVLIIVSISLIFSSYESSSALKNIRNSYLEIDGEIQSTIQSVDNYFELKEENDSLRLALDYVIAEKQKFISSYFELLELKKTVNIRPSDSLNFVYAEVIGRNISELNHSYTINRGSSDSLKINDPVIYKSSLVGRIVALSENYSNVQLYSDHLFEISARIMRLGEVGTIKWNGSDRFDLLYISKNVPILRGDVIVSSGLGDIYPKNIRLGIVDKIETDISGLFHQIEVKADVELNSLRYVSVIQRVNKVAYERYFGAANE